MSRIMQITWALALLTAAASSAQAGYYVNPIEFVEPAGWAVGDGGSTYQLWDNVSLSLDNTAAPDATQTNPAVASPASLKMGGSNIAGPGRIYSPEGDYSLTASIPNHNAGDPGDGTHIIVQVGSLKNPDLGSVLADSFQILDGAGSVIINGGENGDMLRADFFNVLSGVSTPFGAADFENIIVEFYLPNYVGDFKVQWTQVVHTGFDALRVDSMIAPQAFAPTAVPEPATLAVFGAALLTLRRRRTR